MTQKKFFLVSGLLLISYAILLYPTVKGGNFWLEFGLIKVVVIGLVLIKFSEK